MANGSDDSGEHCHQLEASISPADFPSLLILHTIADSLFHGWFSILLLILHPCWFPILADFLIHCWFSINVFYAQTKREVKSHSWFQASAASAATNPLKWLVVQVQISLLYFFHICNFDICHEIQHAVVTPYRAYQNYCSSFLGWNSRGGKLCFSALRSLMKEVKTRKFIRI